MREHIAAIEMRGEEGRRGKVLPLDARPERCGQQPRPALRDLDQPVGGWVDRRIAHIDHTARGKAGEWLLGFLHRHLFGVKPLGHIRRARRQDRQRRSEGDQRDDRVSDRLPVLRGPCVRLVGFGEHDLFASIAGHDAVGHRDKATRGVGRRVEVAAGDRLLKGRVLDVVGIADRRPGNLGHEQKLGLARWRRLAAIDALVRDVPARGCGRHRAKRDVGTGRPEDASGRGELTFFAEPRHPGIGKQD